MRQVHGEEDPNAVDLQPKMQKNPTTTQNGAEAIHSNDVDGKDRDKPARPWAGHMSAKENPTT